MRSGGRPTRLTPEIQRRVSEALRLGVTMADAAEAALVGERTLYRWLARGATATAGEYWQFRQAAVEARSAYDAHLRTTALRVLGDIVERGRLRGLS